MRLPSPYGTNNQRFRIYRNRQLPFAQRSIIDIPVSLGDVGPSMTQYGLPAFLGAALGALTGFGAVRGAILGAATGYAMPAFGPGIADEVGL